MDFGFLSHISATWFRGLFHPIFGISLRISSAFLDFHGIGVSGGKCGKFLVGAYNIRTVDLGRGSFDLHSYVLW